MADTDVTFSSATLTQQIIEPHGSSAALGNTVWHALTSAHESFAIGDDLARRYPPEVSPLAGLANTSEDAYLALINLMQPDEIALLFLNDPLALPEKAQSLLEVKTVTIDQMVCTQPHLLYAPSSLAKPLTDDAIPDMLALTKLTNPGPFETRTIDMGRYIGIWEEGRLAAMAGERLNLAEYIEVSAVCTHPDFRGRGYAKQLVASVALGILEQGKTPILHTLSDNAPAVRVYRSLGFQKSRLVHVAVLKRT